MNTFFSPILNVFVVIFIIRIVCHHLDLYDNNPLRESHIKIKNNQKKYQKKDKEKNQLPKKNMTNRETKFKLISLSSFVNFVLSVGSKCVANVYGSQNEIDS